MSKLFWKDIWDSKGNSDSEDLLYLDGYEHLDIDFNSVSICDKIIQIMDIQKGDRILEVGCGAGYLARELQKYDYIGVDYSKPLVEKHKHLFPKHAVQVAQAGSLPFEENSFDKVFCFGVVQYFPDREYADLALSEMKRVARHSIFLGDLKTRPTRKEHFVYPKDELADSGFEFSECLYLASDVERFNAFCKKDVS